MKEQNFSNHKRYVIGYHGITVLMLVIFLLLAIHNVYVSFKTKTDMRYAIMFLLICFILISVYYYLRAFALKAQDRAIKAEENLRHYILTGKLLDTKLSFSQIAALRFSPDDEFVELSQKAAKENLKSIDIKKLIKEWKSDNERV